MCLEDGGGGGGGKEEGGGGEKGTQYHDATIYNPLIKEGVYSLSTYTHMQVLSGSSQFNFRREN